MVLQPPQIIQKAQRKVAEDFLHRCAAVPLSDLSVAYSLSRPPMILPAVMVRFTLLSVLFGLDNPKKWQAALERKWIPKELQDWLKVETLEALSASCRIGWAHRGVFVEVLANEVGRRLIELAQPRTSASIRQTLRSLFLRRAEVDAQGGIMFDGGYWRCLLAQVEKPLGPHLREEVKARIDGTLGLIDLAASARRYRPMPELRPEQRQALETVAVAEPPERQRALSEAFKAGLFDFIPNLFAATYSAHGRRPHHPLLCFRIALAMMVTGEMNPAEFYKRVDDSVHLRLFLNVFRSSQLPSPRRIKAFLEEKLAPAIEYIVLWFNLKLLEEGSIRMGAEFGTDGMEMAAQARMKSDAAGLHIAPVLAGLLVKIQQFLSAQGRKELSEQERKELLEAFRNLKWSELGNAAKSKTALLEAVGNALEGQFVTPMRAQPPPPAEASQPPPPQTFSELKNLLAREFYEALKGFGDKFGWGTVYDSQCGIRTKHGKTVYGYGMQFLTDLKYGLVWAFAVFPAGESFQPHVAQYVIDFQETYRLGSINLTSDKEFTIGDALHRWHEREDPIVQYGPRANIPAESLGIFTEKDFQLYDDYALCPAGKRLERKPGIAERGSNKQHRFQGKVSECRTCPLRPKCTQGKGPKILCVHIYREDLRKQAERMKADRAKTRDLMGRHRVAAEGTVNNLKSHQGARQALWKGLAMAKLQLGLAILLANALKWHKVKTGQLQPIVLKAAS